jgi:hypothetical protein
MVNQLLGVLIIITLIQHNQWFQIQEEDDDSSRAVYSSNFTLVYKASNQTRLPRL